MREFCEMHENKQKSLRHLNFHEIISIRSAIMNVFDKSIVWIRNPDFPFSMTVFLGIGKSYKMSLLGRKARTSAATVSSKFANAVVDLNA